MRTHLISYMLRFSYPQVEFANAIKKRLTENSYELVDAPCGKGVTTWKFSRNKSITAYGYDINEDSILSAKAAFKGNNLNFGVSDIHNVIWKHKTVKYFCIINSLFLLPEPGNILDTLHEYTQFDCKLFIIVPNVESKGYKWFTSHNPEVNKLSLKQGEFKDFFNRYKWTVSEVEPIVYTRSINRKDVSFFSIFAPLYLRLLNYIQTTFKIGKPNYFVLQLEKNK